MSSEVPSHAMKRWTPLVVWNWLRAWGVPSHLAYALFTARVGGPKLIALYGDACCRRFDPEWSSILGSHDTGIIQTELIQIMAACRYAEGLDFLLPPGDWVRKKTPVSPLCFFYFYFFTPLRSDAFINAHPLKNRWKYHTRICYTNSAP